MSDSLQSENTAERRSHLLAQTRRAMGRYRARLYLVFGFLLVTLGVVAYLVVSTQRYQEAQVRRLEVAEQQLQSLNALMLAMVDAETGERGFVITGDEAFLQPYHTAIVRIDRVMEQLRDEAADDADFRQRLEDLEPVVVETRAQLERIIRLRRTEGLAPAQEAVRSLAVKRRMDELRGQISDWMAEHNRELKTLAREVDRAATLTETAIIVGFGLCGLFLLVMLGMIRREARRREQTLQELTESRDELQGALGLQELLLSGREHLRNFTERLHTCQDLGEAQTVLANELPRLVPLPGGALAVQNPSRVYLEVVHSWGPGAETRSQSVFVPGDCHGLRRGRPSWCTDPANELCCRHLGDGDPVPTVCYPLTAHNQILGSLMLWGENLPRLDKDAQELLAFAAETFSVVLSNLRLQETLRYQAVMDPLTGLYNRRHMEVTLERELARAKRSGEPLAVLMTDIDHFKHYNDSQGHDAADVVLAAVARELSTHSRAEDIACRYGGEEFLLVMPGIKSQDVLARAEQLRANVEKLTPRFHGDTLPGVTLSLGLAVYPDQGGTIEALIRNADGALYQAKKSGRNCVRMADKNPRVGQAEPSPRDS